MKMKLQFIPATAILYGMTLSLKTFAIQREQRRHHLKMTKSKSHPPSNSPTTFLTTSQVSIPTLTPQTSTKPFPNLCENFSVEKPSICFQWLEKSSSTVAPSVVILQTVASGTGSSSTEIPTMLESPEEVSNTSQINVAGEDVYNTVIDGVHSELDKSFLVDNSTSFVIYLGYFHMNITISSQNKEIFNSKELGDVDENHYRSVARYAELAAAKQHLHNVYQVSFLNPVISLNITFVDRGDTNLSKMISRESEFSGSVRFEKINGYPQPKSDDLQSVTTDAFSGTQKERFLEEFRQFYAKDLNASYDVAVRLIAQPKIGLEKIEDYPKPPISGRITGTIIGIFVLAIGALLYLKRKKRINNMLKDRKTFESTSNRIRQTPQLKDICDELKSNDNNDIARITDAYIDSSSIISNSPSEGYLQLNFNDVHADTLRELGVDLKFNDWE